MFEFGVVVCFDILKFGAMCFFHCVVTRIEHELNFNYHVGRLVEMDLPITRGAT